MSANPVARPASRRSFLSGSAAAAAGGMAVMATPSLAAGPDPVFKLVAAELLAWAEFERTSAAWDHAETAHRESGWDRDPRVLIGEFTRTTRGPDFDPIPPAEWEPEPVYAHHHHEIDRDCDREAKAPGVTPEGVAARRERLHRALREDAAGIAAAPETIREREAEEAFSLAHAAWKVAARRLAEGTPTTAAGLVAMIERFEHVVDGCMVSGEDGLDALLATTRAFLTRRA